MNKEDFINELKKLHINITEKQLEQLELYKKLLIEKNKVMNLTALTLEKDIYLKHFYDSLTLIKAHDFKEDLNICDLGSGAGFPGIVLKIVFPSLKIVLVDALKKRVEFLNIVIKELNLKDIIAIHERAEIYSHKEKENFDIVTSRAVAKINTLLELGAQLVKVNGYFTIMKGEVAEELESSKKAISILGFKQEEVISFKLPFENSKRNIIKLKKICKTKNKYPRNFTKIKQSPL